MAPMGLLSAIVSAIRVCGSPSLKAFVRRAQETAGAAELELLSCTSDTTAELWNDGGIARVFGKPQILEVVRLGDPRPADYQDSDGTGIYLFAESINKAWKFSSGTPESPERAKHRSPNLSLNIGIKRRPKGFSKGLPFLFSVFRSPGEQKIGDQVFGSFLARGDGSQFDRYITSSKTNRPDSP
ncbi:hypothetical protein BJX66DRAFT_332180 [Aspergillus keveii]|uniref:Uncharacterized protein n=1 Tax=Aspergillus keveii TaxID=714993 RepID=A0ABR4GNG7_9EURO